MMKIIYPILFKPMKLNRSCRESRPSARGGAGKSEPSIVGCSNKTETFK